MCTATVTAVACTKEEQPTLDPSDNSTVVDTDKKPSEITDAKEVAFAFMQKQSELKSYQIDTTGTTVAKSLISYTQNISNLTIKNGADYFQQATSSSALVKMEHQAFVNGDKVAYRNALTGDLLTAAKTDYTDVYGITPDQTAIGGFVINENTLKSASKVEGEALTYRFDVDVSDSATSNMKRQMKEFGGLKGYPEFTSVRLTLTIKDDWTPVSLAVEADYNIDIAVLGKTSCTQKLESTYSKVNEAVTIPDSADFTAAIGTTTPTEVVTPPLEQSEIMQIAQSFTELDYQTGVHFGVDLGLGLLEQNGLFTDSVETYLYIKLNEGDGNPLNAVNLRWDINLSSAAPLFNFIGMFGDMIPVDFDMTQLSNMYSVSLYYIGDGNLYVVIERANVVTDDWGDIVGIEGSGLPLIVKKVNLVEALLPVITGGGLNGINNIDLDEIINTIEDSFTVTQTETGKTFALKQDLVKTLNEEYNALVDNVVALVSDAAGDMGGFAGIIIDGWFRATINGLEITTVETDGKVTNISLAIKGIPDSSKKTIDLYSLSLNVDGKITDELDGDADKIADLITDEELAAKVREEIKKLTDEMFLGNAYVSRLNKLKEEYNALTEAQQSLVTNATMTIDYESVSTFEYLKDLHDNLKEDADRFIELTNKIDGLTDEEWKELDGLYEEISENEVQLDYIGQEIIDAYLESCDSRLAA